MSENTDKLSDEKLADVMNQFEAFLRIWKLDDSKTEPMPVDKVLELAEQAFWQGIQALNGPAIIPPNVLMCLWAHRSAYLEYKGSTAKKRVRRTKAQIEADEAAKAPPQPASAE